MYCEQELGAVDSVGGRETTPWKETHLQDHGGVFLGLCRTQQGHNDVIITGHSDVIITGHSDIITGRQGAGNAFIVRIVFIFIHLAFLEHVYDI